ncbi:LytTR family DNA-binding domain-containing protein [Kineothrix sp. MB12-C1]|uniref:LytTR family DNA-binding domain-containing protein n=1 Tax=Kineothrix sp. MB12-C1 TaxID=3070215 RepID=UPI0027D2D453|nr:LytTR family DNA-binding domain-containing protein [Kineothrix sp. MB12-C1]WMC94373.1 LytTR family DNA-binding domain-containing protein [Kineothrix sp. MB12-C1]
MKIRINEVPEQEDVEVIINCKKVDEEIMRIITMLRVYDKKLTGIKGDQTYLLDAAKIFYIDTVDKKTFLYTENEVYETPLRLYELEEQLDTAGFFRAGKSVLINFNEIKALKSDFNGRILVTMNNGEKLMVSRQYAVTIKEKLDIV